MLTRTQYYDPEMNRRSFLQTSAAGALLAARAGADMDADIVEYEKPVFDLHKFFTSPVKIASIELLQSRNQFFLRTRSTDGAEGIIQTKDMADYVPILAHRVISTSSAKTRAIWSTLSTRFMPPIPITSWPGRPSGVPWPTWSRAFSI